MDLKWLAEQVKLGRTDVEIAKERGLPVHRVAYYRRAALGVIRQPEGRRKWDVDPGWLAAEVAGGKSDRQIAKEKGMTVSAVRQYRIRHKIDRGHPRGKYWSGKTGEQAANWRGGTMKTGAGYIRVYKPDHPHANKAGYVYEHRYVMEQKIGRLLNPGELVDHIDRNRGNNAPENLRLQTSRSQHVKDHFGARDQLTVALTIIRRYLDNHCAHADAEGMGALCECSLCLDARKLVPAA